MKKIICNSCKTSFQDLFENNYCPKCGQEYLFSDKQFTSLSKHISDFNSIPELNLLIFGKKITLYSGYFHKLSLLDNTVNEPYYSFMKMKNKIAFIDFFPHFEYLIMDNSLSKENLSFTLELNLSEFKDFISNPEKTISQLIKDRNIPDEPFMLEIDKNEAEDIKQTLKQTKLKNVEIAYKNLLKRIS